MERSSGSIFERAAQLLQNGNSEKYDNTEMVQHDVNSGQKGVAEFDEFLFAAAVEQLNKDNYESITLVDYSHIALYNGMAFIFETRDSLKINFAIVPANEDSTTNRSLMELDFSVIMMGGILKDNIIRSKTITANTPGGLFNFVIRQTTVDRKVCSGNTYNTVKSFIYDMFNIVFKDGHVNQELVSRAKELRSSYATKVAQRKSYMPSSVVAKQYSDYKKMLKAKKTGIFNKNISSKVSDAIDKVFNYCALQMEPAQLSMLKTDVCDMMTDYSICNEKVLVGVVLIILLDYYNMGLVNADSCKDTLHATCINTAENIAKEVFS